MQIKAQGLSGLGFSESGTLQAYNDYLNNLGEIESNYNRNKTSLESSYNANKSGYAGEEQKAKSDVEYAYNNTILQNNREKDIKNQELLQQQYEKLAQLEKEYHDSMRASVEDEKYAVQNIKDKYTEREESHKDNLFNKHRDNLETAFLSKIGNDSKISQVDYDNLETDINDWAESVGEERGKLLKSQLEGYKPYIRDPMTPSAVKETIDIGGKEEKISGIHGCNFEITIGEEGEGKTYMVEKGYSASENLGEKLTHYYKKFEGEPDKGATMTYNGKIYVYLYNNQEKEYLWCVVQQRKSSCEKSFKDLCLALGVSPYERNYEDEE